MLLYVLYGLLWVTSGALAYLFLWWSSGREEYTVETLICHVLATIMAPFTCFIALVMGCFKLGDLISSVWENRISPLKRRVLFRRKV